MNDSRSTAEIQVYFIRVRGRVLGPFTLDKLRVLRSRGQFSRVHEFSTDRENWQSASALEHLLGGSSRGGEELAAAAALAAPGAVPPVAPSPAGIALPGAIWYYNIAGELYGPVSIIDLRTMANEGKLRLDDYVWKEGMPNWLPISQIPELKPSSSTSLASAQSSAGGGATVTGGPRTSGFAIASLVLGILGMLVPVVGLLFNLLAVVFGCWALFTIARSRVPLGGRGMAISGLILGLLGLAIWTVLLVSMAGWLGGGAAGLPVIWQN